MAGGFTEMAVPGVAMRVSLNHSQSLVQQSFAGAQQRQVDGMLTTRPNHLATCATAVAQHVAGFANDTRAEVDTGALRHAAVPRNAPRGVGLAASGDGRFQEGVVRQKVE